MEQFYNKNDIVIYNNDNLEVLREIADNSINLIYCDILYNTGKKFDDYNDNLGTPWDAVSWYRPRFLEMKRVLSNNGSIFIHCNWRLDSYIRILMDETFGHNCFRNRIYRKHSEKRNFYSNFDSQVDIILYYVNNPNDFVFNEIYEPHTLPYTVALYENGFIEERSEIRYFNGTEIDLASKNKHWIVSKSQFHHMISQNEVQLIDGLPYRFTTATSIGNLWDTPDMLDNYSRTNVAEVYDTPKPAAILERIIKICSNEGDTVADFFLGGGTTAVVTKKLNRKGIFCDISKKACNVTVDKLEKLNN